MSNLHQFAQVTKYVQREVLNHRRLLHAHIVQLLQVLLTPTHLALVMEYCPGGDLFGYVVKKRGLQEDEGAFDMVVCPTPGSKTRVHPPQQCAGFSSSLLSRSTICINGYVFCWVGVYQRFSIPLADHPQQNIVSRDIKLENTLLDNSPRPLLKLCDFGYSKVCFCCVCVVYTQQMYCPSNTHACTLPA